MTKKCIGCGVTLQSKEEKKLGYVKDETMEYCMRCYRMIHYRDFENAFVTKDTTNIIQKINKKKGTVFYFVDFLNLHEEAISFYQQITIPKVFVVSKVDCIPKSISLLKIKTWLKQNYHIQESIIFVHEKSSRRIQKEIQERKLNPIFFVGITNAGKSSLLNQMIKEETNKKLLTVSEMPNTTLDFIKIEFPNQVKIYDTPGLWYHLVEEKEVLFLSNVKKEIKPKNIPFKKEANLLIQNKIRLSFEEEGSFVWYGSENLNIEKVYAKNQLLLEKKSFSLLIEEQSFLFIKGVGFGYFKKKNTVTIYGIKKENVSLSHSFWR